MDSMLFTQVIPRLRVLETKLLDKSKIDRMIDSTSKEEALKVLQESEYSTLMSNIKRAEDYEIILSAELKRVYKMLYEMTPVNSIVDIMSIRYDYHNIKVLIKGKILEKDFSNMIIPIGTVDINKLIYALDNEYYRDLNPIMRKAIEEALEDFSTSKDPQKIDIILDKYLFIHQLSLNEQIDDKFLDRYLRYLIDLTNIKTLLRVKKQDNTRDFLNSLIIQGGYVDRDKLNSLYNDSVENIPGKLAFTDYSEILKFGIEDYVKTGSINLFEKLSEDFIMNYMKKAKYITFGLEPLIAYIYAKENEIKLIRIIMVGKLNNIQSEVIRERLRENYV
ncbi:V-type ATP synthase subunit C [Clostridium algidicarnis]|uniref:V-type ATP synthase subunit C n=1 Tax=Clostridium algidicarnis TaxID=37659 RepID=UPI001624BE13|nr:V-type ATP synthase subunit C [Clostridium algidicarnis]MBB6697388.1 V-type ATP synthase subunit C [Clostridium algidicarnis]MBU3194527.1 V-type ATP synthase subunit C [Clostridium algidicarnis]MBU3202658.1 V-type ATP synthase subunit C [Clostridium algidicarnis]MBU3206872.1 V-type ATP synthase subunit C [Clostridium algidicarnis]MBU3210812.1 V-type ATP synthase subunit C [Clostridium algidicarnis]